MAVLTTRKTSHRSATVVAAAVLAGLSAGCLVGTDSTATRTGTEHVDSDGYLFLISGSSNQTETTRRAYVEFRDGTVVRKCRA